MLFRPRATSIPFEAGQQSSKDGLLAQRVELDLANDPHALAALEAYADACAAEMPWLADQLRASLGDAAPDLTRCSATVKRVVALARALAAEQPDYAGAAWEHVQAGLAAALAPRAADPQRAKGSHE